jgi:hypothetical protein
MMSSPKTNIQLLLHNVGINIALHSQPGHAAEVL